MKHDGPKGDEPGRDEQPKGQGSSGGGRIPTLEEASVRHGRNGDADDRVNNRRGEENIDENRHDLRLEGTQIDVLASAAPERTASSSAGRLHFAARRNYRT